MEGGSGDDTYVVHETQDKVIEDVDAGTDTARSSITYRLGDNPENLVLTATDALNGFGNAADNKVTGNAGNNGLYGYEGNDWLNGGAGVDVMAGGAGDDTYVVDDVGDKANEGANAGFDTVRRSVSSTLLANVEKLQLLGTAELNGTGNGLANTLVGNSGNNILNGAAGADTMSGGKGDDTY